jgi:O-acetyl-ADP-ribose deacetylase (regulator of RNase III)
VTLIESLVGDITQIEVDAVVNAAKTSLSGGSGVDGAIHAAAGPRLLEACLPLAPCPTGEARVTPGFDLPAKFVVHTVGPVWQGGDQGEPALLAACYRNSLAAAAQVGARSIAFPSISTGIYAYPRELATEVAVAAIKEFVSDNPNAFDRVVLLWLSEADSASASRLI